MSTSTVATSRRGRGSASSDPFARALWWRCWPELALVAATALSLGASFGLSKLLSGYGLGYPGIQAQIPLYVFMFLDALGLDYSIDLSARIREEARQAGTRGR